LSLALVKDALARARRAGACAADAALVEADAREARVRGSEIDFVKQSRRRTFGLRAFVRAPAGLRVAVTSTTDLEASALARLVDDTVELAGATAPDPCAGIPDGGFATDAPDLDLLREEDRAVPLERRIEDARRAEAAARATDPRVTNSEGSEASSRFSRVAFGNSAGFFGEYESASHGIVSMPVASEGGSMQTDWWASVGRALADLENPATVGRRAAERAVRRLGSRRVRTAQVPVVFEPATARSLLGHLASCVSGGALYRKASFLAGKLGSEIASPLVTAVDDGRLRGGLASRPFDGEGLPTRRAVVVERGMLRSFLLDAYAARKLGMAPTGSAARAPGGAPAASATNLWLEPGDSSLEAMVASTERGLLVTWLFGHGFNPVTGDFSRGAAGFWIEDGRLVFPVHEVTIAGRFGEMLEAVDAVGDRVEWLGSVAAPAFRVARMTVAGDA
jgi:PmbA protein